MAGALSSPAVRRTVAVAPTDLGLVVLGSAAWLALVRLPIGHQHGHGGGHIGTSIATWAVMVVATMALAAIPLARHVAPNSLRWRRRRAVVESVAAYLGTWVLSGIPIVAVVGAVPEATLMRHRSDLVAVLLLAAGLWQVSKARGWLTARRRRRSVPLPPGGLRAEVASLRIGVRHGVTDLVACGPLMVPMVVATGALHLGLAIATTALVAVEHLVGLSSREQVAAGAGVSLIALAVAVVG